MNKTIKKIGLAVFVSLTSFVAVNAQNGNAKLIALLNKASWCTVCQANGPRAEKELLPALMQEPNVQFVMNDLSNKQTKKASALLLDKAGLGSFAKENTGTGMLYFVDAKTKMLISSVSIAESNEQIMMTYQAALAKAKMPKHGETGHICDESCKSKMK